VGVAVTPYIRLSAEGGYEHNIIDDPVRSRLSIFNTFPTNALYGAEEHSQYARVVLSGALDLTRWSEFQQKGIALGVEGRQFIGIGETDSNFRLLSGFFHTYVPLNSQQLLAFRVVSQITEDVDGAGVPFFHLPSLGGSRSALGFPTGRFVDNDMVSIMSEYRYEIWRELHSRMRAETFLFFHYGAVGRSLDEIDSGDWHPSYGVGLRLSQPTILMGVAYLGFGGEGMTAGIRTSWPF
jgi:hemolysin activation/secretion protein